MDHYNIKWTVDYKSNIIYKLSQDEIISNLSLDRINSTLSIAEFGNNIWIESTDDYIHFQSWAYYGELKDITEILNCNCFGQNKDCYYGNTITQ
jgi:hypothetical protein